MCAGWRGAERKRNASGGGLWMPRRVISRDRLHDMGFSLSISTTAPKPFLCAIKNSIFRQHPACTEDRCIYLYAFEGRLVDLFEKDHAHSWRVIEKLCPPFIWPYWQILCYVAHIKEISLFKRETPRGCFFLSFCVCVRKRGPKST